jgi:ribose 5-phosphate isomerase B
VTDPVHEAARRAAGRVLAERGAARHPSSSPSTARASGVHVTIRPCDAPDRPAEGTAARAAGDLVSARCLDRVADGESFEVPSGATLTPLAREEAWRRGIELVPPGAARTGSAGPLRVAVGADHGGFAMKQDVLVWIGEAGHVPVDLGTHDENAVDYPDLALAVARAVADGRCDLGVCVDGAGIGSAMAANKVPGVRAAMCYDAQTAANAREHNFANVLTIGGRMLAPAVARDVVRTFLATPTGAERHARRVAKIDAIERRYARDATPTRDA